MSGQVSRKNSELYSLLLLLGVGVLLAFLTIQPYINAILGAIVGAIAFEPLYQRILRLTRKKESVAALLTILIISALCVTPIIFIGKNVVEEGQGLYAQLNVKSNGDLFSNTQKLIAERFGKTIAIDERVINQFLNNSIKSFSDQAGDFVSSIFQIVLRIAIGIFALYYFLKDGDRIRDYLIETSPLGAKYTEQLLDKLKLTIRSTIQGSIVIAVVQAILLGIGFLIFKVPNPFLWSSIGFIAALVPAFGTALVSIPVFIYLLIQGAAWQSFGFLAWGFGLVGLIDNLIRPKLVGRRTGLHPFSVFISVIGGISLFGPMGILWGPIILSLLSTTFESYALMIKEGRE